VAANQITTVGRFSSQMLTYLGTQKTVKSVDNNPTNTFKYKTGYTTFPSAGSVSQADLGGGVVGNYSPEVFNSTRCYFLSRGASEVYAETMTALVIDMSAMLGVGVQALLEQTEKNGQLQFTDEAYTSLNMLRDPGNQVGITRTPSNRESLLYRQVRA
jgi:hypothetical protein